MRQMNAWRVAAMACSLAVLAAAAPAAQPASDRLKPLVPALEKNLRENVVKFWFPRSVDTTNGGYTINYDAAGQPLPGGTKAIVTQARQLWLASRLLRSSYAAHGMREAADAGFRFLRDRMWDGEHGGFYWAVDPSGTKVLQPTKHLYGQAFGLYALSEYAMASGSSEALALAHRLFDLLETRAHDSTFGGYREFFARDWTTPAATVNSPLGAPADMKLMNTHMHLMEALTTYVRAGAGHRARERLAELIAIESQAVIRHRWMAGTDRHQRDWTPVIETTGPGATRIRTATISRTSGSSSMRCGRWTSRSRRTSRFFAACSRPRCASAGTSAAAASSTAASATRPPMVAPGLVGPGGSAGQCPDDVRADR